MHSHRQGNAPRRRLYRMPIMPREVQRLPWLHLPGCPTRPFRILPLALMRITLEDAVGVPTLRILEGLVLRTPDLTRADDGDQDRWVSIVVRPRPRLGLRQDDLHPDAQDLLTSLHAAATHEQAELLQQPGRDRVNELLALAPPHLDDGVGGLLPALAHDLADNWGDESRNAVR
eukprot:1849885-Prymnesium_polylepis.1